MKGEIIMTMKEIAEQVTRIEKSIQCLREDINDLIDEEYTNDDIAGLTMSADNIEYYIGNLRENLNSLYNDEEDN